jgi:uracil-DNA glycosylase
VPHDLEARLRLLQADASSCVTCHDHGFLFDEPDRKARPLFQRHPGGASGVLVVGEAPNQTDSFDPDKGYLTYDRETDETGRFARELLSSVGLAVEEVMFTNSVLCLPARKGERHPVTAKQLTFCRPWLEGLILRSEAARRRHVRQEAAPSAEWDRWARV